MRDTEYLGGILTRLLARAEQVDPAEHERLARAAWDERFTKARSSIPTRFAWVDSRGPTGDFRMSKQWREYIPWFTPDHARRLFELWRSDTNILIIGPPDQGKSSLMALHAMRTLALAGFDVDEVKARREARAEPESLPQVRRAEGLRWFRTTDLLQDNQIHVDVANVATAKAAPVLYLDGIGREMWGATGETHAATSRRVAVSNVVGSRWDDPRKRTIATTDVDLDVLMTLYDGGTFRRLAGERSGVLVIDLYEPQWANVSRGKP